MEKDKKIIAELCIEDDHFGFASNITTALATAESEYNELNNRITESIETLKELTPECDKLDYALAASCGVLCGIIDIFLVGKPGESPVGNVTDKWFGERTKDFAKLCGWKENEKELSSAIAYLENKFKIPYDQRGAGDAAKSVFGLTPTNHHFISLGHNPTLLGLFFSILDQFGIPNSVINNQSHFVINGELIALQNANDSFVLRGKNIPSKFFCAFVNWFGHLISDMSGSSGSQGRGMGIPSPIMSWSNDIIVIKRRLNIPASEFDKSLNELALKMFEEGYDVRFQVAQAIPVFVNEMIVRMVYSVRRMVGYFSTNEKDDRSWRRLWKECEPFSNATVKRMLTIAHGAFCLLDVGDALIRGFAIGGGGFNVVEFAMRLNIVGVGRFTISLYGEFARGIKKKKAKENIVFLRRERIIIEDYINGLTYLSDIYNDKSLLTFVDDLKKSDMYRNAFFKSVELAKLRNVSKDRILASKKDIDNYFRGVK